MREGYVRYTKKRMSVLEALKISENWKPNLVKLGKDLRIPVSSIFDIYKLLKKEHKFEHTVKIYSDLELFEKEKNK